MKIAEKKVGQIHYKLTNEAGELLDSSEGRDPLAYLHGAGNLIPGMEKALEGKAAGEKFQVVIAPEDAYGVRNETLIHAVPLDNFPEKDEVKVGAQFRAGTPQGERLATVVKIEAEQVTVDFNHPLAGVTLHFDVEVIDVRDATEEELAHGHAHGAGGAH